MAADMGRGMAGGAVNVPDIVPSLARNFVIIEGSDAKIETLGRFQSQFVGVEGAAKKQKFQAVSAPVPSGHSLFHIIRVAGILDDPERPPAPPENPS